MGGDVIMTFRPDGSPAAGGPRRATLSSSLSLSSATSPIASRYWLRSMSPEFLRFPSRAAHDRFGREGGGVGAVFSPNGILTPITAVGAVAHLHVLESSTTTRLSGAKSRRSRVGDLRYI